MWEWVRSEWEDKPWELRRKRRRENKENLIIRFRIIKLHITRLLKLLYIYYYSQCTELTLKKTALQKETCFYLTTYIWAWSSAHPIMNFWFLGLIICSSHYKKTTQEYTTTTSKKQALEEEISIIEKLLLYHHPALNYSRNIITTHYHDNYIYYYY